MICIVILIACVIVLAFSVTKLYKDKSENYSLKGSVTCAYALNGTNTLTCNDWIDAKRAGKLCNTSDGCHPNTYGRVCCDQALECCNQIATCAGGKSCQDPLYKPTVNNNLKYDSDVLLDQ